MSHETTAHSANAKTMICSFLIFSLSRENRRISTVSVSHSIVADAKNMNFEHVNSNHFLQNIKTLKYISLPNVETIGNYFLVHNECLESIDFPKLQKVGDYFIYANQTINKVNLPSLKEVGKHCMGRNEALREASFPSLEFADVGFMRSNRQMRDYVKNLLDSRNK